MDILVSVHGYEVVVLDNWASRVSDERYVDFFHSWA
jgi:hypothetical protein